MESADKANQKKRIANFGNDGKKGLHHPCGSAQALHKASTWSAVGGGNIHVPERWSVVTFSKEEV